MLCRRIASNGFVCKPIEPYPGGSQPSPFLDGVNMVSTKSMQRKGGTEPNQEELCCSLRTWTSGFILIILGRLFFSAAHF